MDYAARLNLSSTFGELQYFISGWRFKTFEAFAEGCHRFFEKMGGITQNVRIDNLSPCVVKVLQGSKRIYTKAHERSMEHYGFETLPCRPATGSDKGDVEREIRTHAGRISRFIKLEGLIFKDIEELNDWLSEYCLKRWSEHVKEKWAIERIKLKPLARRDDNVLCKVIPCTATAWGTVRDHSSKAVYSVPDNFIGESCLLVVGPDKVNISLSKSSKQRVSHHRQEEGGRSILLKHVLPSLVRKPAAMIRWAHRDILFPDPQLRRFLKWLGGEDDYQARRKFLECINLIQFTEISEVIAGMKLIQENDSQYPFEDLKSLLLMGHNPSQLPTQSPLTPDLRAYDSLIPQGENKDHETSAANGTVKTA